MEAVSYRFPITVGIIMLAISLVAGLGAGEWTPMAALILMTLAFIVVQIIGALIG